MANLLRWDPFGDTYALQRQMADMMRHFTREPGRSDLPWAPALDAFEEGGTTVIRLELAGVKPDDIDVHVDDGVLVIAGERREDRDVEEGGWIRRERSMGRFERSMRLPRGVDAEQIAARVEHGVLEVRVPKPAEPQVRKVEIEGAGSERTIDVTNEDEPA